jgi:hypothetical protein
LPKLERPCQTIGPLEYDNLSRRVIDLETQILIHLKSDSSDNVIRDTRNHFNIRIKMPVTALQRISLSRVTSVNAVASSSEVSGLWSSPRLCNAGFVLAVKLASRSCNKATTIPCKYGSDSL